MGYSETPQTTAMREGLKKEEEIAQVFISEMAKKGCSGVSLEDCGFFISKYHGFRGASPDRIIHLPTQSSPGVLEMKYIKAKSGVVSFAAVFRDVTQRSPKRNGCSHSNHIPFPLCFKQPIKSVNCK